MPQIPVALLDGRPLPDGAAVRPLFESILRWGVLQPLLVCPAASGYRVIAGRKRLAAALAAGFTTVPCVVLDVSDSEAAAIAEASNTTVARPPMASPVAVPEIPNEIISDLQESVLTIRSSLAAAVGAGLRRRVLDQLVQIELNRQSWLLDAMALVSGSGTGESRELRAGTLLRSVAAGFQVECELGGIDARLVVEGRDLLFSAGETPLRAALACAIGGVLTLIHAADDPRAELIISAREDGSHVVFSIAQNVVPARMWAAARAGRTGRRTGAAGQSPSASFAFDAVRRAADVNEWRVEVREPAGDRPGCEFEIAVPLRPAP